MITKQTEGDFISRGESILVSESRGWENMRKTLKKRNLDNSGMLPLFCVDDCKTSNSGEEVGKAVSANKKPSGIELFAGGGGLALGLEKAGIEGVAFVEVNHAACDTLRKNRPGWNVIEGDIHHVDFTRFRGTVDFVSGGAPCQAFSYAGKKMGFGDTRGTLFAEFARCVSEVTPKMFLFENVRGLLSHDHGRTFETIYNTFVGLGYSVQHRVLGACYYGVGQKRERLIMIGIRHDLTDRILFAYPKPDDHWTTIRDVLQNVPSSPYQPYSEKKRKVMELVPPGGCWVDLPEEVAKDYMGKSYYSGGGAPWHGATYRLG